MVFRVASNTICGVGRVTSSALYSMFTFHMRIMFFTVKITDRQLHPSFTLLIQLLVIFFFSGLREKSLKQENQVDIIHKCPAGYTTYVIHKFQF